MKIRETQMSDSFPIDTSQSDSASISVPGSKKESVQLILVGSPKGLTKIIYTLYRLGFAEVIEWSQLSPTAKRGKMLSTMNRRILL